MMLTTLDCTSVRVYISRQAEAKKIDDVLTSVSKLAAATRLRLVRYYWNRFWTRLLFLPRPCKPTRRFDRLAVS